MRRWIATALGLAAMLAVSADARDRPPPAAGAWIASWGSAQMVPDGENALPADRATDVTLRQLVRLSAGGSRVRVRLSNAFGTRPLPIGAGHLAIAAAPGTARIAAGAALTFAGRPVAIIPAGAEIYSDPVALAVPAGGDLAISLYLPEAPATGHPGARARSFLLAGNHVADRDLPGAVPATRWYALADIEVPAAPGGGTVVAIGDSITDGYGVEPDRNTRWPDVLAERLRAGTATRGVGVVNAGIGGNRVLLDGLGPNLLARFDRDVIARGGVRWAIVLEGINDLGVLTRDAPVGPARHRAIVADVTAAYRQLAQRAHAHGIRVIGGTVTPFVGNEYYHPDAALEADRQAINAFIRTSGVFDAVIDFDRVLRDPARPDRLAASYDSGDHLHPSEAGYRAMGEAVPLALFAGDGARADRPTIALTFDDIPVHGPVPPGRTRAGIVGVIARTLTTERVPAYGFLNAGTGLGDPDAAAAIAAWRGACLPLGNHGYLHLDLDEVGADAFAADIVRNEPALALPAPAVPAPADRRWFRYPFLAEGRTPALLDTTRAFLRARDYRVAAVTMDFSDYNWNAPYAACLARRDLAAIRRLERGFLDDARQAALASRARARTRSGGDIPYVLLMHVGAFDAHMLPRLLALYRSMGFGFTTLAAAQAHSFYAAAADLTLPGPTASLGGPPPTTRPLTGPPAGLCQ